MKVILASIILGIFLSGCAMTLPYRQEYTLVNPLPEVTIGITPFGNGWDLEITNNTENIIKFLIDESSYVTTDGKAERLIRGHTRVIHSDSAQPPLPIPPKASFKDSLFPEKIMLYGELAPYVSLKPVNPESLAKFYLVFEIDGKKKTVVYNVKFVKED